MQKIIWNYHQNDQAADQRVDSEVLNGNDSHMRNQCRVLISNQHLLECRNTGRLWLMEEQTRSFLPSFNHSIFHSTSVSSHDLWNSSPKFLLRMILQLFFVIFMILWTLWHLIPFAKLSHRATQAWHPTLTQRNMKKNPDKKIIRMSRSVKVFSMWRQHALKYQQGAPALITFLDFSALGIELAILQSLVHFYNHQTTNTPHPIFPSMLFSLWTCITLAHVSKVQFQFTSLLRETFSGLLRHINPRDKYRER